MKVREYLRKSNVKWVNHCPRKKNEACLLTAIVTCYGQCSIDSEVIVKRVQATIEQQGEKRITAWNDDPNRSLAEVLELVDKLDI